MILPDIIVKYLLLSVVALAKVHRWLRNGVGGKP